MPKGVDPARNKYETSNFFILIKIDRSYLLNYKNYIDTAMKWNEMFNLNESEKEKPTWNIAD